MPMFTNLPGTVLSLPQFTIPDYHQEAPAPQPPNPLLSPLAQLLERLEREKRIEVSSLKLDCEHVFWLAYYGFVLLEVDYVDCVFLIRNPEVMSTLRRKAS